MADKIIVQYYEFCLKTKGRHNFLPPIDHVKIHDTFKLLESNLSSLIHPYTFNNNQYSTTIEHLVVTPTKIDIVFGYYDGLAPNRTLKNKLTGAIDVQVRDADQSVKHLCHCVIKLDADNPLLASMGIEHVVGMPVSILVKTLNWFLKNLKRLVPNSESIFQVTNPDNANNPDGTPNIARFGVVSSLYPMAGTMLEEAIRGGRLNKIRVKGEVTSNFNDPNNRLTCLTGALDFKVTPLQPNDTPKSYLRSLVDAVNKNNLKLSNVSTFAIIENQTGQDQTIALDSTNSLNSAFVLKKSFDPEAGRLAHPNNTQINQVFLNEVWRLF